MNASLRPPSPPSPLFRPVLQVLLTALLLGLGTPSTAAHPCLAFLAALPVSGTEPSDPRITSPTSPCTITAGTALTFVGEYAGGKNPRWTVRAPDGTTTTFALNASTGSYTFANPGTYTVSFLVGPDLNYAGGSTSMNVQVNGATPKPTLSFFKATPSSIVTGGSTTLSWSQTGATSLSLNTGQTLQATDTQIVVSPAATTTYVLTATNSAGSVQLSAAVTVSPVALSAVAPANPVVNAGSTVQFSATVTGAANQGVTWSVNGGGVIDGSGLFTATTAGSYTVTARSVADTSKTASTGVTVKSIVTGVTLSPLSVTLNAGGSTTFTAQATGVGGQDPSVTWGASGGTVSAGTYTAPVAGGTYTVTATSVQDPSRSSAATVTVSPVTISAVSPAGVSVSLGTNVQFSATVSGAASAAILWSADNGGSIDGGGLFTTTATGTYTITAASALDPSKYSRTTLTVTDLPGSASMAVITAPADAVTVATNSPQSFSASSSADAGSFPNYVATGYAWDFGDGTQASGATASHAYGSPGTCTVTLTVTYQFDQCKIRTPDGGCLAYQTRTGTRTATRTIIVKAPPSIASFTATPSTVLAGLPVTLAWSTTNASSLVISGVGTVTASTSWVVTPTAPAQYTLTATNEVGHVERTVSVSTYTVGVSVTPVTAALALGESRAFSATVTPANQGVAWTSTLAGAMSGSTFTGLAPGTYTVTATSLEDPSKSNSATVTVSAASLSALSPLDPTLNVGAVAQFTVSVSGALDPAVTWSVTPLQASPSDGASLDGSGRFTASKAGQYRVTATSVTDPSKASSTTVTVKSIVTGVTVSPDGASLPAGGTLPFTALVSGLGGNDPGVQWRCSGGTITAEGLYSAPLTGGTYTVRATSTQDSSQFREVTVTVSSLELSAITPSNPEIFVGGTVRLSATVTGAANAGVVWSVASPQGPTTDATIDSTGLFTGKAPGAFTVTAASAASPGTSLTTTVTVKVKTFLPKWKRDIVYLGGIEVAEIEPTGAVQTTLTDHLGTPRLVVGANGVVESVQKYLPFGQLMEQQGSLATSKGFTNHEQTDASGLIYMQARFYLPMYGRFASPDPARDQHFEETQSWNIYSYCQNNPIMAVDPDGMTLKEWIDRLNGAGYAIQDNLTFALSGGLQRVFGFDVTSQSRAFYEGAIAGSGLTAALGTGAAAGGGAATAAELASVVGAPAAVVMTPLAVAGGLEAAKSAAAVGTYTMMAAKAGSGENESSPQGSQGGAGFTGGNSSTQGNVKVGKQTVRVDVEAPTGGSSGNVHIQVKGAGSNKIPKTYLENLSDLSKLPGSIRNNSKVQELVEKALAKLNAMRGL